MNAKLFLMLGAFCLLTASPAAAQQDPYAIRLQNQVHNLESGWTTDNHPNTYEQRTENRYKEEQRRNGDRPQTYYTTQQQRFLQQLREQQRVQVQGGGNPGYYNAH